MERILIIEDEAPMRTALADLLAAEGYRTLTAADGEIGLQRALSEKPDLILLDIMMPKLDGFAVCAELRRLASDVPVLMLTARGEEADRIVGLEIGADDYLPKTFSSRELLARIRAVTRRTSRAAAPEKDSDAEIVIDALRINPGARTAALGDQPLVLTPVEFELLLSLARAKGRVKTRDHLLEEIREREYEVFDRSIDVHISALRKKLGDDPKTPHFIRTVRAAGYMLIDPDAASY